MALIIPKNNADAQTLDETLRIYYVANDWVPNSVLINKLSAALDDLGIENEKKEPQSYTKKTQVLAYFGFITWSDVTNSQSSRKITELGRKFYEARLNKDDDKVIAVLIESLSTCTFGRNVIGCDSDSDIEAPNVFIKASLLLKGITNNEFAFVLGRMEFHGEEFHDAVLKVKVNRLRDVKTYPEENAKKWNDPKPITALKNWGFFNSDNNTISDDVFSKYFDSLLSLRTKNTEKVRFKSPNTDSTPSTFVDDDYSCYLTAIRTKPFLLLAGISGTGKSQKVQELAFMTCPDGDLRNEGGTTPGNYCLVEVKPNWHDSTELLGYYSTLSGKYELTDFIRFVYKATQNKNVPFFLCLDEMNLAPVEQYFAEYLSVLETRKKVGDEILTQYLLSKDCFSNCKLQKKVLVKEDGDIIEGDKQYKIEFLYSEKDSEIITYLKENGLTLPDNLFVIGTVNMDDTTHQFSRKVIDRAFTIEMNGGKMSEMFSPESKILLEYRDEPVPLKAFKAEFVRAYEVMDDEKFAKYKEVISTRIPELLGDSDGTAVADSINGILNETPFRVSYRVQNELVLYLSTLIERAKFPDQIEGLIGEATLAILLEKVLPRVQGEQKQLETQNGKSNVLKDLKTFVENHFKPEEDTDANLLYDQVLRKLKEMDDKLANYYTNFF